jgi:hypothetical protein
MSKSAAQLCICLLLVAAIRPAFADTTKDSTYGPGGTKSVETSSHEGKDFRDTSYRDSKGNLRQKDSEVAGPDGKVSTTDKFAPNGNKTSSDRKESNAAGKPTGGVSERYDDNGIQVGGTKWTTDASGKEHYQAWNPQSGRYEESSGKVEYVDGAGNLHQQVWNPNTHQLDDLNPSKYTNYGGDQPKKKSIIQLNSEGKLQILGSEGTGQTIGHVGDLKLKNVSSEPVSCVVPAMVFESKSRQNQDYACPREQDVTLQPNETKTVPIDGICVNRDKPPVGKGVIGDLVVNTGDPTAPPNPDCHTPPDKCRDLLRMCKSKYDAADKLADDGSLKDIPYHDKQKQKDIVVQWSTWSDPRICEITGAPVATKDDLKKVVYKQVEEHGPVRPDTKKKVDEGIDTIFDKIELTTTKAKDLEHPGQGEVTELAGDSANTFNISDNQEGATDSPAPGTQEKKKKGEGKGKKEKKEKGPVKNWIDKARAANAADRHQRWAHDYYNADKQDFFKKSKHHEELVDKIKKAQAFLNGLSNTAEQNDKAIKERDEAKKELAKLEGELEKDFNKTDEGKKAFGEMTKADKEAQQAHDAEKEAGKNIDPAVKEELEKSGALEPVHAKW